MIGLIGLCWLYGRRESRLSLFVSLWKEGRVPCPLLVHESMTSLVFTLYHKGMQRDPWWYSAFSHVVQAIVNEA